MSTPKHRSETVKDRKKVLVHIGEHHLRTEVDKKDENIEENNAESGDGDDEGFCGDSHCKLVVQDLIHRQR